ncbi:inositol-trisphosphate 3-kinase-like protein isoform X4 [Rhodnius prolixus]
MVNTGGSVRQLPSRPHLDALTMSTAVEQFRKLLTGKGSSAKDSWRPTCCTANNKRCRKQTEESLLLKCLALNALELSAPASDVLLRTHQCPATTTTTTNTGNSANSGWFQLSGHPDAFAPAGPGTVWKKCSGGEERSVYEALAGEPALRDITPAYFRQVLYGGQTFIELQDLLHGFRDPHVMDVKLGTRTFLESEVQNTIARHDLYLKMVAVDAGAPTDAERQVEAVTKLRYMQFREQQSSTCSLGFRIEAMKFRGTPPVTDLKRVKNTGDVSDTMALFLGNHEDVRQRIVARLQEIRYKLDQSHYFKKHEVIGSSILILYDDTKVGAWLIDFAKTRPVPDGCILNHRSPWTPGNHEEGFLFGLDNLIRVLENVKITTTENTVPSSKPLALKS